MIMWATVWLMSDATASDDSGEPLIRLLERRFHRQVEEAQQFDDSSLEYRRLFSEVWGTFLLVVVAAGGGVVGAQVFGSDLTLAMKALAPGMMVMGIIFFMGTISGAHLNPAVTLAFAVRGNFPWLRVPGYIAAQFIGRLLGDPMTDRWGRERVAAAGGLLVALGFVLVIAAPVYAVAFAGFTLAGFGCATLVPAAFAAAGRLPGFAHGTGIALLGWLMRLGFLFTSPVIGVLSDATSLRAAMLVPLAAGLIAALIAHGIRRAATRDANAGLTSS